MRDHPIPEVTEPFQYRAIGIVRGIYRPESVEKFTRGKLIDINGDEIDSVVLGRVITLMRRHLEVDNPHLWVVYPRCREVDQLHLQISGIWEPSTLSTTLSSNNDSIAQLSSYERQKLDELPEGDDYFSIRGELIYTRPENNELVVKIRQKSRANGKRPLPFKLIIQGKIPIDLIRHFLNLNVRRKSQNLVLEEFQSIGVVQNKKPKKKGSKISSSRKIGNN